MALEDQYLPAATAASSVGASGGARSGGYRSRRRLPTASSSSGAGGNGRFDGDPAAVSVVDDHYRHNDHDQRDECQQQRPASSSSSAVVRGYFNSEAARAHFHVPSSTFPDAVAEMESRIGRLHAAWVSMEGWKKLLRDPRGDASHFSRLDQFTLLKKALLVKTAMRKMLRLPPELSPERQQSSTPTAAEVAGDFVSCCRGAVQEVDVNVRLGTTVKNWCEEFNSQGGYFGIPAKPNGHAASRLTMARRGKKRKVEKTSAAPATTMASSSSDDENAAKKEMGAGECSTDATADAAAALSTIGVALEKADDSSTAPAPDPARPRGSSAAAAGSSAASDGVTDDGEDTRPERSSDADPDPAPNPADSGEVSKRFMHMFNQLKAYRDEHGHCNVSSKDKDNPKLGRWVRTVRNHRKQYDAGTNNVIGDGTPSHTFKKAARAKIELLDGIGFEWVLNSNRRSWDEYLADLRAYKKRHGDLLVPFQHDTLGLFVDKQRRLHRQLLEGGSSDNLTPARIQQLNDLGFTWELTSKDRHTMLRKRGGPNFASWDSSFDEMMKFRKENPDGNPRSNSRLGMWIRRQRHNRRLIQAGKYGAGLTEERIARLDEVGFDWGSSVTTAGASSDSRD